MKNTLQYGMSWVEKYFWHLLISATLVFLLVPTPSSGVPFLSQTKVSRESFDLVESSVMSSAPRMAKMATPMVLGGEMAYASDGFVPDATETKIIKNASLNLETTDTEVARVQIEDKIKAFGGSITNMSSWSVRPDVLGYNLSVRIPAEKLDQALIDISKLGQKKSENIYTTDITAQYQDTENQIKNLVVRRDRLREMMERDTEKLSDVLEIDRELWSVQNQIEMMTRQQVGRDKDVAFSQLEISLQPEPRIGDTENPTWSAKKSWKTAVNDLLNYAQRLADRTLRLVVFTPIWLPVLLLGFFIRRKYFRSKKTT